MHCVCVCNSESFSDLYTFISFFESHVLLLQSFFYIYIMLTTSTNFINKRIKKCFIVTWQFFFSFFFFLIYKHIDPSIYVNFLSFSKSFNDIFYCEIFDHLNLVYLIYMNIVNEHLELTKHDSLKKSHRYVS